MAWKVVIVEDEDLLREGLRTCFDWEKMGYEVVGASDNGKRALDLIKEKRPDVVFTDIKMPFMDGITMTEKLKEVYPDIKTIIISGYDDFEYARRALKAGVSEYILKPVNLKRLEAMLKNLDQELKERESRKREWSRLHEVEESSKPSIRQNIFGKILLHKIPVEEWNDTPALIAEEYARLYYSVVIVDRRDFAMISMDCDYLDIVEMDGRFENKIRQHLTGEDSVDILKENNCERLLCIRGATEEACRRKREDIKRIFKENQDAMEEAEYTFGHVYQGFHGLYHSYLYAKRLRERQYAYTLDEMLKAEKDVDTKIKYMNYDADTLFHEIRSGTKERVEKELEKFEKELQREKIFSHMHVVLIISNLYFELTKLPEEIGGNINDILGEPMEHYHKMLENSKRKEMLGYLKKICLMINTYFMEAQEGKTIGILKRITDYIKENYANEELSMKDVARQAYISVSYLGIILKKETGKTFIEYLTEIRIQQARKFLVETDLKNYEIAMKCGYSNPTYFSTVFKGLEGMSPSAYRKENKPNIERKL